MLKPNIKKLGLMAFAGFMTVGAVAPAVSVHANEGTTPVSYDNRSFVPGTSEFGFIIPTAITFNGDTFQTVNADLAIIGINGYDLKADFEELSVSADVASEKDYKMLLNGTTASDYALYQLEYFGKRYDGGTAPNKGGKLTHYNITHNLGIGTNTASNSQGKGKPNSETVAGKAKLMNKNYAKVKGNYKDTLHYKFHVYKTVKK